METTINGQPMKFEPHPLDTAVDVIRNQAGLTGTKMACGGGRDNNRLAFLQPV